MKLFNRVSKEEKELHDAFQGLLEQVAYCIDLVDRIDKARKEQIKQLEQMIKVMEEFARPRHIQAKIRGDASRKEREV